MLGDVIRACMARKILVQLSIDTHEFEKYSRGATKYTRFTRTRASSLNRAVPYAISILQHFTSQYYRIGNNIAESCHIAGNTIGLIA